MRAAAFFAASLVAIGLYLAIAAAFAFAPTWIGLGMLAISAVAAVGLVATSGRSASAHDPVEGWALAPGQPTAR